MNSLPAHTRCLAFQGIALHPLTVAVLISIASHAHGVTVLPSSATSVLLSSDTAYTVDSGTTISTSINNAIQVNGIAPVTFVNGGTIISSLDNVAAGIRFNVDGSLTNLASGAILGHTYGVYLASGGSNCNVTNFGDISARISHAISYDLTTSGTVENFGTINSGTAGPISATSDGVQMNSTGTLLLNNHAGALIRSGTGDATYGFAVWIAAGTATINNDGALNGYHEGIRVTSAGTVSVTNSNTGTIQGNVGAGVQLWQNSTLVNNGQISSTSAPAILLIGSNNAVTLGTGSALAGANNNVIL